MGRPSKSAYCTWCRFYQYTNLTDTCKCCTKFNVYSRQERDEQCGGLFKERVTDVKNCFKPESKQCDSSFYTTELTRDQLYKYFDAIKHHRRFYLNASRKKV